MPSDNFLDTTVDGWRAVMECQDDPGLSAIEIADETGMSLRTAQKQIRKLLKCGGCKQGSAERVDAMGRRQRVPVYQLIPQGKKAGK